ncbi:helix-turn-helix domain-containing protein [Chryseobacterium populi]|uniref:Putative transcriptional regulator n=1 Tax=Chryseobacterium populi TaxID=1144316 RepID=J3CBM2_9FLAO|nr:helix-turn-helix transcriptional regulator [Chryseobacterium populi]EJL68191.1 putative transcriptional regulator [Chryseobacterium populi]
MTTLGTKLRRLRDDKKMSQTEIANILGVSQSAYNKWEADQAKPSSDNLLKISDFHNVEIKDLLEDNVGIVSNNIFKDSSVSHHIFNYAQTVNMQSPELIENIVKNQEQIFKMIELQTQLIERLLKK